MLKNPSKTVELVHAVADSEFLLSLKSWSLLVLVKYVYSLHMYFKCDSTGN